MQTTNDLLDRVKKVQGIESDYRLAQVLEVSRNAISSYRRGNSRPEDEVALRLAALIDRDPASVIAELHAERAKTPEVRALWMRMANQLRHAVAAVMLCMGAAMLMLGASPSTAEASTGSPAQNNSAGLCIMLNRVRTARAAMWRGVRYFVVRGLLPLFRGIGARCSAVQSERQLTEKDNRDDCATDAFPRAPLATGA